MTHDHSQVQRERSTAGRNPADEEAAESGAGHSMWWMVACCAPMVLLVLAILLGLFGPR